MKKDSEQFFLCADNVYDTRYQITYDEYCKIKNDLDTKKVNYILFDIVRQVVDHEDLPIQCQSESSIVVNSMTFLKYLDICE